MEQKNSDLKKTIEFAIEASNVYNYVYDVFFCLVLYCIVLEHFRKNCPKSNTIIKYNDLKSISRYYFCPNF